MLSGGGFRAALYALGVLRYLAEASLLSRVVAISAVSGGSIAAAALADKWTEFQAAGGDESAFRSTVDASLRDAVTSKNLRRRWMIRSAFAARPVLGRQGSGSVDGELDRV